MTSNSKKFQKLQPRSTSPAVLLSIMIISSLAVAIFMAYEYQSRQKDYLRLLEKQAVLFINTLLNSTQHAIAAAETIERQINNRILASLRLVEQLDSSQSLSDKRLRNLLTIAEFEALHIYDNSGKLVCQVKVDTSSFIRLPTAMIRARLDAARPDTLLSIVDALNPQEDRIIATVGRRRGGLIAAVISPSEINTLKRTLGIGYILKRFQSEESIEYVVIQNSQTIVAGSFEGYSLSTYSKDLLLTRVQKEETTMNRILNYQDYLVFESVSPFYLDEIPFGVLRLGLAMEEYEHLRKDAGKRLFLIAAVLIVFGLVFVNFLINYRHRKLLHRDLGRLQEYTNTILENLTSGVISVDGQGLIQTINKKAAQLLNLDPPQTIYKHYSILPAVCHDFIESQLRSTKTVPLSIQKWINTSERQKRLCVLQSNRLLGEDNDQSVILIIDDITNQTQLEAQLKRNQRLAALRNQALSVAHEIKNPLNGIKLIVDLIRKKFIPTADESLYIKQLNTVSQEIQRINDIIEQYLRFSRPPTLTIASISFPELLDEVSNLFTPKLNERGIRIRMELDGHQPLHGDPALLKQVFINLIKNAEESIVKKGRIDIQAIETDSCYEIQIQDNGTGIPARDQESIFDLHFTTKESGSGIGLAVVQQIVLAHHAIIEVDSQEGSGTKILLRFPLENTMIQSEDKYNSGT